MKLDFGREVCGQTAVSITREWLVTNGIGGYASGTIPGVLTRRYHGLLMAALKPPVGRTLLLAKIDETAEYDGIYPQSGHFYPLYANQWADGTMEPANNYYLNHFRLEGTIPVWTYGIGNALLEKRIWMKKGENTTYIQYHLTRATGPMSLEAKAFVNYRDYHSTTIINDWEPEITAVDAGLKINMFESAVPFYLKSQQAVIVPQFDWYEDFFLSIEEYRGQSDIEEDHIYAALIRMTLQPGESMTLVVSTEESAHLDGDQALLEARAYEDALLLNSGLPKEVNQLVLAADQFVVSRPTAQEKDGRSIIAGYHWFSDWGRDTMISLPGLTLCTQRYDVAASILRTFAQFVDQGMLPNRFPDAGEEPEYNTVDATLWYFEAIRAYVDAAKDETLLQNLFPILQEIIAWYIKGTRYNIHMDPEDHLIYAGEEGIQLTWMDAKVDDWVVTPRIGKPVEISALWYNALCTMNHFAQRLQEDGSQYVELATAVKEGFQRFWNPKMGYCYDVIDGPDGEDGSLRPNQLLAISLEYSPLSAVQQRSALDACSRHLLTAHGLRSLSPDDDAYQGHYGGDQHKRDGAYHQGTVWSWLIGPFVAAHFKIYNDPVTARSYLEPLFHHLKAHGIGSVSEIFDGDAPFTPRGCIAQAWSVAELLRMWQLSTPPRRF